MKSNLTSDKEHNEINEIIITNFASSKGKVLKSASTSLNFKSVFNMG